MTIFRFKRAAPPVPAVGFVAGERLLWIENKGDGDLRVMLEPWCDIVDIPPGQYARLAAIFETELDEYHVQYHSDAYLGVYCPASTTITVVEERWKKS